MAFIEVRVDVWELRCRFNKGRYWKRLKRNELRAQIKGHPASPKYNLGLGGQSQELYIYDPQTGTQVARAHQLLKANGKLGGGGKPDPKELFIGNFHYRMHRGSGHGGDIQRDPSLQYSWGVMTWLYKRWRWIKCQIKGR